MQQATAAEMSAAIKGGVLLDKPTPEPESQIPAAAGRVIIAVRPESKGRTTRWRAVCSGCGTVGLEESKMRTDKKAADHAESTHPNKALIATRK